MLNEYRKFFGEKTKIEQCGQVWMIKNLNRTTLERILNPPAVLAVTFKDEVKLKNDPTLVLP